MENEGHVQEKNHIFLKVIKIGESCNLSVIFDIFWGKKQNKAYFAMPDTLDKPMDKIQAKSPERSSRYWLL